MQNRLQIWVADREVGSKIKPVEGALELQI
jgi:hypothetical protein